HEWETESDYMTRRKQRIIRNMCEIPPHCNGNMDNWKERYTSKLMCIALSKKVQARKSTNLKKNHVIRPTVKADIDNYTKAILDSCNGILWRDDSQVVSLIANKYYSDNPRIEIEVDKIEQK